MGFIDASLDMRALIDGRELETHFQPITSIRRQSVLGMEALSRGRSEGGLISPGHLFAQAQAQNTIADLDSLCRDVALESFSALGQACEELMLFVNLHPATTRAGDDVDGLLRLVERAGIAPNRVVIELLEIAFDAPEAALELVHRLRSEGFLIALDDMGVGHSNLDRIAQIRPDILKVDRSLIQGIENDYIKREVFKSLVLLSERVGGWLIAEGVETSEQALAVLELGGDMMQGFYFARPAPLQSVTVPPVPTLVECGQTFKKHTLDRVCANRRRYDARLETINLLVETLRRAPRHEFEARLQQRSTDFPRIESACVLDEDGTQLTGTVLFCPTPMMVPKMVIFAAPAQGTDHSFKEYFYLLCEARLNPFVTQPYVPLPSGDLCVSISTFVRDSDCQNCVLVVHFHAEPEEMGRTEPVEKVGVSE